MDQTARKVTWLRQGGRGREWTSAAITRPSVLRRPVLHPPPRRVSLASPTSTRRAVDCEGRGLPEVPRISRRPQWRSAREGPGCVAEVKAFPEYMLWEKKHQNTGRKVRGAGQGPTEVRAWNPGARATPAASAPGEDGHEGKYDRTPSRFLTASLSLHSTSRVYSFPFSSVLSFLFSIYCHVFHFTSNYPSPSFLAYLAYFCSSFFTSLCLSFPCLTLSSLFVCT